MIKYLWPSHDRYFKDSISLSKKNVMRMLNAYTEIGEIKINFILIELCSLLYQLVKINQSIEPCSSFCTDYLIYKT